MSAFFVSMPIGIIRENWAQLTGAAPPDELTGPVNVAVDEALQTHDLHSYQLRMGVLGRQEYVQLYVILSPPQTERMDHQCMDKFRQMLYTKLCETYDDLVLDVIFTTDSAWSKLR
jgi:predicted Co/Zn/Cd cation transporter (cation efflux family)